MWTWILLAAAGYLLLQKAGGASSVAGPPPGPFSLFGPGSNPATWAGGVAPGTVTIGGQPAGDGWTVAGAAGNVGTAITAAKLTGSAVGAVAGVASASGAFASGGIMASGGALAPLGTALPLIGIGVALVATVLSILAAHHAQSLAAEGKALNDADARMCNAQVICFQGILNAQLTLATAQTALAQITADWYGEVKNIERGRWPYTGQDLSADFIKVWQQRFQPAPGAPGFSDYHAPDPCNGACVIGHFFAERNAFLVLAAGRDALAGNHGTLTLPAIPAHDTQTGMPEIQVVY
jgi:hypothetical protein